MKGAINIGLHCQQNKGKLEVVYHHKKTLSLIRITGKTLMPNRVFVAQYVHTLKTLR